MTWQGSLTYLAVAIVLLDAVSGGYATAKLSEAIFGPLGANIVQASECAFAVMYTKPTAQFLGLAVPIPSGDDVALALAVFSILYYLIWKPRGWRQTIGVLALIWFLIRITAAHFAYSIPGCLPIVEGAAQITGPLYWVSIIAIPFLVIKFFRRGE